jgi:hypothetical protein
MQLAELSKKKF